MDEWPVHAGDISVSWLPSVRSEFWLAWNNSGPHLRSWQSWFSSGWMTELVGPLSLLSTGPYTRLFVMLCHPLPGNLWGWNREETDLAVFFGVCFIHLAWFMRWESPLAWVLKTPMTGLSWCCIQDATGPVRHSHTGITEGIPLLLDGISEWWEAWNKWEYSYEYYFIFEENREDPLMVIFLKVSCLQYESWLPWWP